MAELGAPMSFGLAQRDREHREWFEALVVRRLSLVTLFDGLTDVEIRRERIRAAIVTAKVQDVAPMGGKDPRTWSDLYGAVYGRELTPATAATDDRRLKGDTSGSV